MTRDRLRCPCCGHLWETQAAYDDHAEYMQKFGMWPDQFEV